MARARNSIRSPVALSRATTPPDAASVDDQILGRNVLDDLDRGASAYRFDQRLENLVAGRVAAGFDDAAALMRGLASQRELAGVGAIERGAQLEKFLDARGRVLREDLDDLRVADAGAGALRVDGVQARRIVGAHRRGDPALRPIRRRAFAEPSLA